MFNYFHAPLPVVDTAVHSEQALELRAAILNQRMLDEYYAKQKAGNVEEYKRITGTDNI